MSVVPYPQKLKALQQKRATPAGPDFSPTHPWAVRAFCEWLKRHGEPLQTLTCLEPACGKGHMVRALAEYFAKVSGYDLIDYGAGFKVRDFTKGRLLKADWTITNPPYADKGAEKFMLRALASGQRGSAVLVRSGLAEGVDRYAEIYSQKPPTDIVQFVERVPLVMGRLDPEATTATAYCWMVWRRARIGKPTIFHWIPPCAARLKHASDYRE